MHKNQKVEQKTAKLAIFSSIKNEKKKSIMDATLLGLRVDTRFTDTRRRPGNEYWVSSGLFWNGRNITIMSYTKKREMGSYPT